MNEIQLTDLVAKLPDNDKLVRRWGFEAEHPAINDARREASYWQTAPFEFVSDGSVPNEQEDCECDCEDCEYHDCNCDNCERSGWDPDHCSSSYCYGVNELSTAEPILTAWNSKLDPMLEVCKDAEESSYYNDPTGKSWAGHLHVEARDLTARQVVTALQVFNKLMSLAPEWVNGWQDSYNTDTATPERLREWQSGKGFSLPRSMAVTAYNLGNRHQPQPYEIGQTPYGKTTIEFRSFRTTFDSDLIRVRGAIARAVVEYGKRNELGLYWVARCQTFAEVLEVIEFGHH